MLNNKELIKDITKAQFKKIFIIALKITFLGAIICSTSELPFWICLGLGSLSLTVINIVHDLYTLYKLPKILENSQNNYMEALQEIEKELNKVKKNKDHKKD